MIELRFFRHVVAPAKQGNYARAAQVLNLTEPALSRSIAALEVQPGVKLFHRDHQGVHPTVSGNLVINRGGETQSRVTG